MSVTYNTIVGKLKIFCDELSAIEREKENDLLSYDSYFNQLVADAEKEKVENKEREKKLKAFIDIAKAHALKFIDSGCIEEYDTGVLSRLSVQIDSSSKEDPFAEQLFTHAFCQLRYVMQSSEKIDRKVRQEREKVEYHKKRTNLLGPKIEAVNEKIRNYLTSDEFTEFIKELLTASEHFENKGEDYSYEKLTNIGIGTKQVKLPTPEGFESEIFEACKGFYDINSHVIAIPEYVNLKDDEGLLIRYINKNEDEVLRGIQNIILNILQYSQNEYSRIAFIDPVRFNNSSLGILQQLSVGDDSVIDNVPLNSDDVQKRIDELMNEIESKEREGNYLYNVPVSKQLMILHDFPNAYNPSVISSVKQLIMNASRYKIKIILTNNASSKNTSSEEIINLIKDRFKVINSNEAKFVIEEGYSEKDFSWYIPPERLPEHVVRNYIEEKPVRNDSNDYNDRVGINRTNWRKGNRYIEQIPYGVDEAGNLMCLDFENSNFATFICGASRSGKSTLLHTIITGIIKSNHPDDVEVWLIDFKMTEFSRYLDHCPPHVRYIILDESPELVYDIIDRLTEILIKRQNKFKGKWQKLSDVPKEKYMPAIFVIIDEFSVMSQIIADSVSEGKENYGIKLQTLLAKGAALGFHFIFSSQGFSDGSRGLTQFSKEQIQQRIAMKTGIDEIKNTLDLRSASDSDKLMMEQLQVHHSLVRVPMDIHGNRLKKSKVLYITDYSAQERLIDNVSNSVESVPVFNPTEIREYIDKKTVKVDGNSYCSFDSNAEQIQDYINSRVETDDDLLLFVGEPRRMIPLIPIEISNSFSENMLIISPLNEKMSMASIIMSMANSLGFVDRKIDIWTQKKNKVYEQISLNPNKHTGSIHKTLSAICEDVKDLRNKIDNRIEGERYIVVLGSESIFMDMSYQGSAKPSFSKEKGNNKLASLKIEKRNEGEADILTMLKMATNSSVDLSFESQNPTTEVPKEKESISEIADKYDARDDIKYILMHGPKMGYHLIFVYNSVGEFKQSKLDIALFKHKILFRTTKQDAMDVVGVSGSKAYSEIEDRIFRYTNGLDTVSFRPFLHPGLAWDGWSMNTSGLEDEEEEYLM